jgi:hypothetical protein
MAGTTTLLQCHFVSNLILIDVADVLDGLLTDIFCTTSSTLPNYLLGSRPSSCACLRKRTDTVLARVLCGEGEQGFIHLIDARIVGQAAASTSCLYQAKIPGSRGTLKKLSACVFPSSI